ILLWNYVVTSNTSLTRTKTISDIEGYVTGQSTLATYGLAIRNNPGDEIDDVTVRLQVPQASFGKASSENIQVTLDLSSVRSAGAQEVALKASTTLGRVVEIIPDKITLDVEQLDSRSIPVNVEFAEAEGEGRWYNVTRMNPANITVSGAGSVVRSVAQARVYADAVDSDGTFVRTEPYVLLDNEGNEISAEMLTRSTTSVTIMAEGYPTKELPISKLVEDVVIGEPAEGYQVSSVTLQPENITVAAAKELLSGISELKIEPVSVDGMKQSFSVTARIPLLPDFKYASAEQVYVNIGITEEDIGAWVENTTVNFIGKADNLMLDWSGDAVQVHVKGHRSDVEALIRDGVGITVDLSGLGAGEHSCDMIFPTENYPDVEFTPETPSIHLTLTETPEE
ncbi:MAG: hypothetical protein IJA26_00815, partial [Clostridia bacterium]|nr:hypothetical protein [Clostridia bacterium]